MTGCGPSRRVFRRHDCRAAGLGSGKRGIALSHPVIWKTLAELGLTVKERWLRAAEQDRAGVAEVRTVWPKEMPTLNSAKLVFLDETCAMTVSAG
jgi:hypothetical protein